jgi:HEAT repeat protein
MLGEIGDPQAITALEFARDNDFGVNYEGDTVSIRAKEALEKFKTQNS